MEGALMAVSARGAPPGGRPATRETSMSTEPAQALQGALDALANGRVRALVWDHTAVAQQIVCRAGRSRWLTFTLGPGGVYRFRALEQLYQADVRAVGDALVATLGGADRPAARTV